MSVIFQLQILTQNHYSDCDVDISTKKYETLNLTYFKYITYNLSYRGGKLAGSKFFFERIK